MKDQKWRSSDGLIHGIAPIQGRWKLACTWYASPIGIAGIEHVEDDNVVVTCVPCWVELLSVFRARS